MKVESRICDQCGVALEKSVTVRFNIRNESDYDKGGLT